MKKLIFAFVAGSILALVATTGVYARHANANPISNPAKTISSGDSIAPVTENRSIMKSINNKAIRNFAKSYRKVANEKWSVISDGFIASFNENDVRTIVYYNKNGGWSGTLKGYTEDKMSHSLRDLVKRKYYDFKITYVNEVENLESAGKPTYIVHMEDEKNILQVRVNEDVMEVWKEFNKSK